MKKFLMLMATLSLFASSTTVYGETTTNSTTTTTQTETTTTNETVVKSLQLTGTENTATSKDSSETAAKPATQHDNDAIFDFPHISWKTYGELRTLLMSEDYKVPKAEMDTYTNAQLYSAFSLFKRYNDDFTGMDLGTYTKVLRALFRDKTLDWDTISPQLTFNPNDYKTWNDLLPHVETFNTYLKTLYGNNCPIQPIKSMTTAELKTLLEKASQAKMDDVSDVGRVDLLRIVIKMDEAGQLIPPATTPTTTNSTSPAPTTTTSKEAAAATTTTTSSTTKKTTTTTTKPAAKIQKAAVLPQTGEGNTFLLSIVGIILLSASLALIWQKKRSTDNKG